MGFLAIFWYYQQVTGWTLPVIAALTVAAIGAAWKIYVDRFHNVKIRVKLLHDVPYPGTLLHKERILLRITNIGQRETTLSRAELLVFKFKSDIKVKKVAYRPIMLVTENGDLPAKLGKGEPWHCLVENSQEFQEKTKYGLLYCEIDHSLSNKRLLIRIET